LLALADGRRPSQVAKDFGVSRPTVYIWIHRFNEQGLHGLDDRARSGRPHTYTAEQRAEVIATALTDPKSLGLPFGCWTLDRLQAYLKEQKDIPIKRSRIDEILLEEGLRWRHQETWFGARVDPAFAEKRGSLKHSTRSRRRVRSSSASTRWAPTVPRASRDSNPSTPNRVRTPMAPSRPPSEPDRRSTTAAAAKGISSAPSARRLARR
ncbi:MAG TPA: helix-turn-helix domain-containing protein, partial [Isosphaeraceae bacterium]|nr:helix-turn-helix domain-containing protein [Isosphaeraceae bacterium]